MSNLARLAGLAQGGGRTVDGAVTRMPLVHRLSLGRLRALAGRFVRPLAVGAAAALGIGAGAFVTGCTPHIGDHCNLNTDCSLDGTRVCDNASNNGYCTSFNCGPNTCIDNAVCVMLYPSVPGCPFNGYQAPSRTQRTLCLKGCGQNSDCRGSEGYECADPASAPWDALILDDNTHQKVCIARPEVDGGQVSPSYDAGDAAPVCLPEGPVVPPIGDGASD
jgi:hypothetical protein